MVEKYNNISPYKVHRYTLLLPHEEIKNAVRSPDGSNLQEDIKKDRRSGLFDLSAIEKLSNQN